MPGPSKEAFLQHTRDGYDTHLKTANYLFVAHGAGFVGCLSVLKDHANVPQLKGVGLYIILFGIGFLAGILNYVALIFARAVAVNAAIRDEDPHRLTANFLLWVHLIGLVGSIIVLVVALVEIMCRFHSL
jgi:hypothetical protein